jgi:hypothetical protein
MVTGDLDGVLCALESLEELGLAVAPGLDVLLQPASSIVTLKPAVKNMDNDFFILLSPLIYGLTFLIID